MTIKKTNNIQMRKIIALIGFVAILTACNVAQQLAGAYNMTQCKYEYKSISGLTLNGINLSNVNSVSALNPLTLAKLVSAFSSSSGTLPLNFTLNLDVTNPNTQTALLNGLSYILEIDGLEMTQGVMQQKVEIAGKGKSVLPLTLGFDLKKVTSGKSMETLKNLAFNFAGIGGNPSNVTFRIKPNFTIGGSTISAPAYIPVSFTLNKK
jgi:LEA14-like dessication related protein